MQHEKTKSGSCTSHEKVKETYDTHNDSSNNNILYNQKNKNKNKKFMLLGQMILVRMLSNLEASILWNLQMAMYDPSQRRTIFLK